MALPTSVRSSRAGEDTGTEPRGQEDQKQNSPRTRRLALLPPGTQGTNPLAPPALTPRSVPVISPNPGATLALRRDELATARGLFTPARVPPGGLSSVAGHRAHGAPASSALSTPSWSVPGRSRCACTCLSHPLRPLRAPRSLKTRPRFLSQHTASPAEKTNRDARGVKAGPLRARLQGPARQDPPLRTPRTRQRRSGPPRPVRGPHNPAGAFLHTWVPPGKSCRWWTIDGGL